jgi:pimeloyl-ACP methyl ester carboxylesterase
MGCFHRLVRAGSRIWSPVGLEIAGRFAHGSRQRELAIGKPKARRFCHGLHGGFTKWTYLDDADRTPTKDQVLDDITLYWLTNTGTSAGRLYWENGGANPNSAAAQRTTEISLPVAITVFPGESYQTPRSWAERAYPNLTYFSNVGSGGHFAAWEQPELFSAELRAAFNSLR